MHDATTTTSARTDICNCPHATFCHAHLRHGVAIMHLLLHFRISTPVCYPCLATPLPIISTRTRRLFHMSCAFAGGLGLGWLPPPPRGQVAYGAPQSPTLSRFVYHMRCRRPVLPAIDDSHLRFFPHSVACCCPTHDAAARHYAARFLLSTISRYLHVICHVFPLASSSPRLLILLRTPLGWWGGGCGSSSYPHGQVTNRHAVWSSNVVHHACPSNPLCCRHLLLFNLRPSFMSSTTPISFCLLISSSPPLPRRFHPCSSPPRHLAFSPSGLRLLLALGRFGGCPPPPPQDVWSGRSSARGVSRPPPGPRPHPWERVLLPAPSAASASSAR
jgi:hypothetical protein